LSFSAAVAERRHIPGTTQLRGQRIDVREYSPG